MKSKIKVILDELVSSNIPPSVILSIKDSSPRSYPNITSLNDGFNDKHALHGRMLEIFMLKFITNTYSYCGRAQPTP